MNKSLGRKGEDQAVKYITRKGYMVVDRNVYIGGGEIDIIARKKGFLIFIEVKTRKNDSYIDALDIIDERKSQQLIDSCEEYLTQKNLLEKDYRIDLISVIISPIKQEIKHVPGII